LKDTSKRVINNISSLLSGHAIMRLLSWQNNERKQSDGIQ